MNRKLELLLVDDDDEFARDFAILGQGIFDITRAPAGEQALEMLGQHEPDAVILDLRLGAGMDGLETLRRIRANYQDVPVIMVTDHAEVETAVEAMKLGAFHYTSKHPNMKELHAIIMRELRQISWKNLFLDKSDSQFGDMVGASPAMKSIFKMIPRCAQSDANILIHGETGTGKELLAREIHRQSTRSNYPFVAIDCSAIPAGLFESELFGHERGAFTGAVGRMKGKFELADGGTIFLDEITNLDYNLQPKLLRVLEDRSFARVGSEKSISVNVRIIAACNRDIQVEVKEGRFRQDLFFRLNTIPIHLPPLRERREDIPALIEYFVKSCLRKSNTKYLGFTNEAIKKLKNYQWPGNIRELKNLVERTLILHPNKKIEPNDIEFFRAPHNVSGLFGKFLTLPYAQARDQLLLDFKRAYISDLIHRNEGNITQAAREAQIPRSSLHRMMKEIE